MAEQDFLAQIRQAEKEAADSITAALEIARQNIQDARNKAAECLSEAYAAAQHIQQDLINKAEQQADMIRTDAEEKAGLATSRMVSDTESKVEQAARLVAERIVSDRGNR